MVQGGDGVGGFEDVGAVGGGPSSCFVEHEVGQRGPDAFDLGGEDGLFADVAVDEEGGVGEQFGDGVEAAEGGGGGFEEVAETLAGADLRGGWERAGDEGADGFSAVDGRCVGAGGFALHGGWPFVPQEILFVARRRQRLAVGETDGRIRRWQGDKKDSSLSLLLVLSLGKNSC